LENWKSWFMFKLVRRFSRTNRGVEEKFLTINSLGSSKMLYFVSEKVVGIKFFFLMCTGTCGRFITKPLLSTNSDPNLIEIQSKKAYRDQTKNSKYLWGRSLITLCKKTNFQTPLPLVTNFAWPVAKSQTPLPPKMRM